MTAHLVGIVPAAGYATRMQSLSGSKELLSVGGGPVIDHLLDRLKEAGCADIRIVTRPEKKDVIEHVHKLDLEVVTGHPSSVSESISLGLAGVPEDSVVLLGFPDTIWEPRDGFTHLLAALDDPYDVVLGLFWFDEPERGDVVTMADVRVIEVEVKPTAARSNWIWGCAVARNSALRDLAEHPEPGVLFDKLARAGRVAGLALSRTYTDIGTPAALEAGRRAYEDS